MPLRERNGLLLAAGFAPLFRASTLDDPALAPVRTALDALLRQHEPYPAVVLNRHWDIVESNGAAARFFGSCSRDARARRGQRAPPDVSPRRAAASRRELGRGRPFAGPARAPRSDRWRIGRRRAALLAEVLDYPGVPARLRTPNLEAPLVPVVPVTFRHRGQAFRFFSAVTVLGTPQDITVQELRIESFFPLDDATAMAARNLAL